RRSADARWRHRHERCARNGGGRVEDRMPSAPRARLRDGLLGLWDRQPPADHSRKAASEEHQQFRAVARIEAELRALSECQQAEWQWRLAIDADQRFGTNEIAGRPEQRMAALHGAHLNSVHAIDRALEQRRIDMLNAAAVRPEALIAHNQRQSDRVD